MEDEEISAEHIDFGDVVWRKVQEEAEKYYSGQEILGWFLARHSLKMETTDVLRRIHLKYFGGGRKGADVDGPVGEGGGLFPL